MRKKLKNVKPGDVFEVKYPDGVVRHAQFFNTDPIKTGKHTIKFTRPDGVTLELSNDDYVEVIAGGHLKAGIAKAAKEAFKAEKERKSKQ